ncbi:MAG TPA: hypothetical protein VMM18_05575 [Gemmatimonadaceae bacterium]|nr:hypothetical protein [Gemmatimonadaceae bacterium]
MGLHSSARTLVVSVLVASSLVFAVLLPAAACAQRAAVGVTVASANHHLLNEPLAGGWARLRIGGENQISWQLGIELLGAAGNRIGVPCGGFIQPGTCHQETVRDAARITAVRAGPRVRLLSGERATASLTADVDLAVVRVATRGLASDLSISAVKVLKGGALGLEASWSPWDRFPLAFETAVAAGGYLPLFREQVSDAYTPFEHAFAVRRLRFGVSWHTASKNGR